MKLNLLLTILILFTTLTGNAETKKYYGIAGPQLIPHAKVKKESSYMVNGVGYTTRTHNDSKDYVREGIASYYHNNLTGNSTANGEIYHPAKFTAAHKTLPLGSYAVITNLNNNRKVIVKINDRGPFVKTRLIDLSKIAAQEIGMLSSGIAKVRVESLHIDPNGKLSGPAVSTLIKTAKTKEAFEKLDPKVTETKNNTQKENTSDTYTVRILNVQNQKHADELIQKLAHKKIKSKVKKNNQNFEVYLENISSKADVYQLKNTLSKIDNTKQLIVYTYN